MNGGIDKLSLEVSVSGAKESINDLTTLSKVVSRLQGQLGAFHKLDLSKVGGQLKEIAKISASVGAFGGKGAKEKGGNVPTVGFDATELGEINTKLDLYQRKLDFINEQLQGEIKNEKQFLSLKSQQLTLESQIEKETATFDTTGLGEINTKLDLYQKKLDFVNEQLQGEIKSEKQFLSLKSQQVALENQIAKEKEKEAVVEDDSEKSQKSNLLASIKRVAIYRAIRTVIKAIAQSVKESANEIAKISPETNKALSQMTSSLSVLKASLGNIVIQLLPVLNVALQGVTNIISNLSNNFAILIARLKGESTYVKVNTDYWKEYNNAVKGTLLSFDTFTTLSYQDTGMEGLFSTEKIDVGGFEALTGTLSGILNILITIGGLKIVNSFLDGLFKKKLDETKDGIEATNTSTRTLKTTLQGVALILGGIVELTSGISDALNYFRNGEIAKGILSVVKALGGLLAVVGGIMAIYNPAGIGKVLATIGLITGAVTGITTTFFADGGMFEGAGTMYAVAGESGAEIVAQGSAGTGVVNVEQFKQAMVEALYEYGASRGNFSDISLNLDGNKVGQAVASSSYREMQRQGLLK